jgi:D-inositol-3-phosphate glycosyltransferase
MILRVALVTHGYQTSWGVSIMTDFLYRVLRESGRFEPEIISLAHSASDSASVRLRSPATWRRGIQLVRASRNDVPFVHFGAWFSELEFQRYRPRAKLTEMLNGYDLVQFVVGTPPWMWAAARVQRPKFLWTATMTRSDRASRIQKARPLRRWWLRAMTPLAEQYEHGGLRIASEVFALSNYTLAGVRAVLGNGSGILATCGVDTNSFHPDPTRPKKFILCVGRLNDPRKNIALLLEAYARLRRNVSNAPELWLVGPQPPPEAMRLIREHGLTETVRLQGPRKHADLPRIYQSAICFVLSSDEEGLGIVLLEAMACGLPVVCTACGGPETAIEHDRTGFLVPVGDAEALSSAMGRLLASPSLRERFGQEARKVSLERFSIDEAARVFLEKYERTLSAAQRFNGG